MKISLSMVIDIHFICILIKLQVPLTWEHNTKCLEKSGKGQNTKTP